MKHPGSKQFLFPLLCILMLFFDGCQKNAAPIPVSPFSDATWEYTKEDILNYEGENYSTYDSVYGGICYTFPKNYQGYQGTVKYMLDANERLMCIAWTYSSTDEQELYTLFESIQQAVYETNGDTSYETDKPTNYGNVWYREEGNLILSTMITTDLKALQYSYLNPEVSSSSN